MTGPEPSRRCEMVLLVQAEFDGELDAAQAATLAAHRAQCPVCQAAGRTLAQARELMREAPYLPLPDAVRRRVLARLDAAQPVQAPPQHLWSRLRAWWGAGIGFGLGAACAAALSLLILLPAAPDLTQEVVAGHIRALQPGHLEDVVSTDRHTVKPWFDGRLDFAPPVKDLAAVGFPLKGARLDYLGSRAVAALVYQRDKHVIDLFVWPVAGGVGGTRATTERHGYNVVHWNWNGMALWAVSDIEPSQLRAFAKAWERSP
jgi:anti-sigma factor RsiW